MLQPFPTELLERRKVHAEITALAPSMQSEIAAVKKMFPSASLVYFRSGDIEYGSPTPPGGYVIPPDLGRPPSVQLPVKRTR